MKFAFPQFFCFHSWRKIFSCSFYFFLFLFGFMLLSRFKYQEVIWVFIHIFYMSLLSLYLSVPLALTLSFIFLASAAALSQRCFSLVPPSTCRIPRLSSLASSSPFYILSLSSVPPLSVQRKWSIEAAQRQLIVSIAASTVRIVPLAEQLPNTSVVFFSSFFLMSAVFTSPTCEWGRTMGRQGVGSLWSTWKNDNILISAQAQLVF